MVTHSIVVLVVFLGVIETSALTWMGEMSGSWNNTIRSVLTSKETKAITCSFSGKWFKCVNPLRESQHIHLVLGKDEDHRFAIDQSTRFSKAKWQRWDLAHHDKDDVWFLENGVISLDHETTLNYSAASTYETRDKQDTHGCFASSGYITSGTGRFEGYTGAIAYVQQFHENIALGYFDTYYAITVRKSDKLNFDTSNAPPALRVKPLRYPWEKWGGDQRWEPRREPRRTYEASFAVRESDLLTDLQNKIRTSRPTSFARGIPNTMQVALSDGTCLRTKDHVRCFSMGRSTDMTLRYRGKDDVEFAIENGEPTATTVVLETLDTVYDGNRYKETGVFHFGPTNSFDFVGDFAHEAKYESFRATITGGRGVFRGARGVMSYIYSSSSDEMSFSQLVIVGFY
ncbi:hypothetical protein AAMO2058_000421400 [Amorphochlora amoebiformis]